MSVKTMPVKISAPQILVKFISGAMALAMLISFGTVLLGDPNKALAQSTVTYQFCVWDTFAEDGDRINLDIDNRRILSDHELKNQEHCERVVVTLRRATNVKVTTTDDGNPHNTSAIRILSETGQPVTRDNGTEVTGNWDLCLIGNRDHPNCVGLGESQEWLLWPISEDTVLFNRPEDPPEFTVGSISSRNYVANEAIADLILPEAIGGATPLTYALDPAPPPGLTFDPGTRTLSGTPAAASPASTYTYTATDAGGQSVSLSFTIKVDETRGVMLSARALTTMEGQEGVYSVSLRSSPDEGGTVVVQPRSANPHIRFTPDSLTFDSGNWAAPQSIAFTVGEGNEDESLTIDHAVDGYGDARDSEAAEGGTVMVSVTQSLASEFAYRLCAYDRAAPDDDDVNIYVNGDPVFTSLVLRNEESCTPIRLRRNVRNSIGVQAISVGTGDPPVNTAALRIRHATDNTILEGDGWELNAGDQRIWDVYAISANEVSLVPRQQPSVKAEALQGTVAGIAAATVSNVTSNIGARFSAPSAPTGGVSVSVAGSPLSFGQARSKHGEPVFPAHRVGAAGEDRWQWRHRTMSADDLLRSSSFAVSLGAAEGTESVSPGLGSRVTIWGRGDLQFFESGGGSKSGYDGDLVAGYLGADLAMEGGWLAGVAVSRIASEADYTLGAAAEGGGTLEAELTNVHPYIRAVLGERSEAWAILGFGTGEVTDLVQDGPESKSDLSMRMLSAGVRHLLESDMGIDLAVLGDGSFATVETEDGVQSVDGISADVWRARLGVEASRTAVSETGSSVTSFLEVAARTDGGDGAEGVGLELSPGLSFSDPDNGFAFEARGRALALHSADNHREYGASLTASLAPGAGGRGLSMALTPSWGTPDNALHESNSGLFLGDTEESRSEETLSLNARLAYGFGAGRGVVSPFAELSLHDGDRRRMRIGSRYSLGSLLDLELSGDRSDGASGAAHSVQLSGRLRF